MSGHPPTLRLPAPERLNLGAMILDKVLLAVGLVGLVISIIGGICQPAQFAYSWFLAFYFFFTIALGAFFWVMLHYACDSDWSVVVRRIWENILGLIPLLFLIFLPLLVFAPLRETLWKWMSPHADAHEVHLRHLVLNGPFFYAKVALYFFYFGLAGAWYRRASIRQDLDGNPILTQRMHDHSYLALVIFGLLETFLGFDWFMGLDWRWASSLFGVYNFGVVAQAGLAAAIVLVYLFRGGGWLGMLNAEHFFLMGKLLFGFTIFWGYVAFGQYLLIWFANIPEETIFYNDHNRGHWVHLTHFLIVGKFMFPVIFLLSQEVKKNLNFLAGIAAWLLFMHGVELYWFIMPYAHASILPSWLDFVAFGTVTCLLGWWFLRLSASASLFPVRDPRLVECLTVTN